MSMAGNVQMPDRAVMPPELRDLIRLVQDNMIGNQQLMNSWQVNDEDNVGVDHGHPLNLKVYIPPESSLLVARLSFTQEAFRSYSATTAGGGGLAATTESGGSDQRTSSNIRDATYITPSAQTGITDDHRHSYSWISLDHHYHDVDLPDHVHDILLEDHVHDVEHGIYLGTEATDTRVYVNGVNRTPQLGGGAGFGANQVDLDLTPYMEVGGWNYVALTSAVLGRINASVFIQALTSLRMG